jgi:mono/diheme cytochrome c family protein
MRSSLLRTTAILSAVALAAACASGGGSTASTGAGTAAKATAAPAAPKLPAGVTVAMIAMGDSIFNNASCQRCHGKGGVGANNGPAFTAGMTWQHGDGSYAAIVKTITEGVPKEQIKVTTRPFGMRPRGGVQPALTDAQVNAVAAYVYKLSHP